MSLQLFNALILRCFTFVSRAVMIVSQRGLAENSHEVVTKTRHFPYNKGDNVR